MADGLGLARSLAMSSSSFTTSASDLESIDHATLADVSGGVPVVRAAKAAGKLAMRGLEAAWTYSSASDSYQGYKAAREEGKGVLPSIGAGFNALINGRE